MGSTPYVMEKDICKQGSEAVFPNSCYDYGGKSAYCKPFEFRTMFAIRKKNIHYKSQGSNQSQFMIITTLS